MAEETLYYIYKHDGATDSLHRAPRPDVKTEKGTSAAAVGSAAKAKAEHAGTLRVTAPRARKVAAERSKAAAGSCDSLSCDSLSCDSLAMADSVAEEPGVPVFFDLFEAESAHAWQRASDSLFREADAAEIFGARSVREEVQPLYAMETHPLIRQPLFQAWVLILAFTFALMVNKFWPDVKALMGNVFTYHNTGDRLSPGSNNNNLFRLLNSSAWVGAFLIGALCVRFFGEFVPDEVSGVLEQTTGAAAALTAAAALVAVVLYQFLALGCAGEVLLCRPFITQLWQIKRICFSVLVIFAAPPVLLYMFIPSGSGAWLLLAMAVTLAVTLFLYIKETLGLFISKKISILHWFLYLCTVELFPVSLLGLIVVKRL